MRHKRRRSPVPLRAIKPPSKGKFGHRLVAKVVHEGREYFLHATKGYRSGRA